MDWAMKERRPSQRRHAELGGDARAGLPLSVEQDGTDTHGVCEPVQSGPQRKTTNL